MFAYVIPWNFYVSIVIFDPASFYGHQEFDLGIASMFGGFPNAFWQAYHSVIPKEAGWQKRNELYQLFHYINHWYVYFWMKSNVKWFPHRSAGTICQDWLGNILKKKKKRLERRAIQRLEKVAFFLCYTLAKVVSDFIEANFKHLLQIGSHKLFVILHPAMQSNFKVKTK